MLGVADWFAGSGDRCTILLCCTVPYATIDVQCRTCTCATLDTQAAMRLAFCSSPCSMRDTGVSAPPAAVLLIWRSCRLRIAGSDCRVAGSSRTCVQHTSLWLKPAAVRLFQIFFAPYCREACSYAYRSSTSITSPT